MSEPHLGFVREGHIAIVTFNRPEARNAWSLEMMARMADAWDEIDGDDDIRVAVLTGAGGTFSAGADLKLMHSDQSDNPWHARFREDPSLHWKAMLRSYALKKPLIAAITGTLIWLSAFGIRLSPITPSAFIGGFSPPNSFKSRPAENDRPAPVIMIV